MDYNADDVGMFSFAYISISTMNLHANTKTYGWAYSFTSIFGRYLRPKGIPTAKCKFKRCSP